MAVHDWTRVDVPAPLDATYQTTWGVFPAALKGLLERD